MKLTHILCNYIRVCTMYVVLLLRVCNQLYYIYYSIYTKSSHQCGCYKISSSSYGGDGPDIDNVGKFGNFGGGCLCTGCGCCNIGCCCCCIVGAIDDCG